PVAEEAQPQSTRVADDQQHVRRRRRDLLAQRLRHHWEQVHACDRQIVRADLHDPAVDQFRVDQCDEEVLVVAALARIAALQHSGAVRRVAVELAQAPLDQLGAVAPARVGKELEAVVLFYHVGHDVYRDVVYLGEEPVEDLPPLIVVAERAAASELAVAGEHHARLLGRDADEKLVSHRTTLPAALRRLTGRTLSGSYLELPEDIVHGREHRPKDESQYQAQYHGERRLDELHRLVDRLSDVPAIEVVHVHERGIERSGRFAQAQHAHDQVGEDARILERFGQAVAGGDLLGSAAQAVRDHAVADDLFAVAQRIEDGDSRAVHHGEEAREARQD